MAAIEKDFIFITFRIVSEELTNDRRVLAK